MEKLRRSKRRIAALALAFLMNFDFGAIAQPNSSSGAQSLSPFVAPWGDLDVAKDFDAKPNGEDFARNYPERAVQNGVIGAAVLCCKLNADRTLACRAAAEWPESKWGFGMASVQIGRKFRLAPSAIQKVNAYPDAEIRMPIEWQLWPMSRKGLDVMSQAASVLGRAQLCLGETPRVPVPQSLTPG